MTVNTNAYFPELALIELAKTDDLGSGINITTQVSSWTESGFARPTESDPYFGNAKVKIKQSQEDGEVSFDVVITNSQWYQIFHGGTGSDFTSGSSQDDYRVTVLIRDDNVTVGSQDIDPTMPAEAGLATGSLYGAGNALRVVYVEATATSFEPELEADGYLQGTITFTIPPTDEVGAGNVRIQEKQANVGSEVAALGSYTSLAKW